MKIEKVTSKKIIEDQLKAHDDLIDLILPYFHKMLETYPDDDNLKCDMISNILIKVIVTLKISEFAFYKSHEFMFDEFLIALKHFYTEKRKYLEEQIKEEIRKLENFEE